MNNKTIFFVFIFLILFSGCSDKTRSRGNGIGLREGYNISKANFIANNWPVTASDDNVNILAEKRFPIFVQLEENLNSNWVSSQQYFDISSEKVSDLPPTLNTFTYADLIKQNSVNGIEQTFSVPGALTQTLNFLEEYPEYQSIADSLSDPAVSADYSVSNIVGGKRWGVFYPASESNRFFTVGYGFGINYSDGYYSINFCDPYVVTTEKIELPVTVNNQTHSRKGICSNKVKLYENKLSQWGISTSLILKLYSFVGEDFEINLIETESYTSFLDRTFESNRSSLEPIFRKSFTNLVSIIYRL